MSLKKMPDKSVVEKFKSCPVDPKPILKKLFKGRSSLESEKYKAKKKILKTFFLKANLARAVLSVLTAI